MTMFKYKITFLGDYFTLNKLLDDNQQYECHLGTWPSDPYVLCKSATDVNFIVELMIDSKYEISAIIDLENHSIIDFKSGENFLQPM